MTKNEQKKINKNNWETNKQKLVEIHDNMEVYEYFLVITKPTNVNKIFSSYIFRYEGEFT